MGGVKMVERYLEMQGEREWGSRVVGGCCKAVSCGVEVGYLPLRACACVCACVCDCVCEGRL